MTNLRLSHSQAMKFIECSKAWEFHYNKKYRPILTSSALLFGNILDSAIEVYLNTKSEPDAYTRLYEYWNKQEINGVSYNLYDCTKIIYANSDYDEELLTLEDRQTLVIEEGADWSDSLKKIYEIKSQIGFELLKKEDKVLLNKANWFSMRRKGELMLKKAIEVINENLIETLGTQVKVELTNGAGDSIVGYADAILRWKGYDVPITFDFKTSTKQYANDSVTTSPQLSLYTHELSAKYNTRLAGFFVLHKIIKKNRIKVCSKCSFDGTGGRHKTCNNEINGTRCGADWIEEIHPEATHQIIVSEIPERLEEIVIENMDMVNCSIKAGIYPRNFSACEKPWGSCPYKKLCFDNKMDGLIVKDDK